MASKMVDLLQLGVSKFGNALKNKTTTRKDIPHAGGSIPVTAMSNPTTGYTGSYQHGGANTYWGSPSGDVDFSQYNNKVSHGVGAVQDVGVNPPYQHGTNNGTTTWRDNTGKVITNATAKQPDGSFTNTIYNQGLIDNPNALMHEVFQDAYRKYDAQAQANSDALRGRLGNIGSQYDAVLNGLNKPLGSGQGGNMYLDLAQRENPFYAMPDSIAQRPEMMSGKGMADLLGVIYDEQAMRGRLDDATRAKYANMDTEWGRTQDSFYDAIGTQAELMMGALRRGDRDAMRSGTSVGAQGAQELSALLGISQQGSDMATEMSQQRADLVSQREAEQAQNALKALQMYNDMGLNLGNIGTSKLNAEMTGYAGELARDAGLQAGAMNADAMLRSGLFGAASGIDTTNLNNQQREKESVRSSADTRRGQDINAALQQANIDATRLTERERNALQLQLAKMTEAQSRAFLNSPQFQMMYGK